MNISERYNSTFFGFVNKISLTTYIKAGIFAPMNKQELEVKKSRATKTLALVGLAGIVLFLAWTSVQLVQVAPSAFSALVSIADNVYGPTHKAYDLQVVTSDDIITTDETTTLSWNQTREPGTYGFSYDCLDGVALSLVSEGDEDHLLECNTNYELDTVSNVVVRGASAKERFVDVPITVTYLPNNGSAQRVSDTDMITIVNDRIHPLSDRLEPTSETETSEPVASTPSPEPAVVTTTPEPEITYTAPVFIPVPVTEPVNPLVDLVASFKGVGVLNEQNFTNRTNLERDEASAVQFEVTNTGTITSDVWSYLAVLPTGTTYQSDVQAPLAPGARAILTLGFTAPSKTGTYPFSLLVITERDVDESTNILEWSTKVE